MRDVCLEEREIGWGLLDSYFIEGFKYDGKAVFGVIETAENIETVGWFLFGILSINC